MTTLDLSSVLALVGTLSVATQKLVDIVKAWIPPLTAPGPNANPPPSSASEAKRQRWVQFTAGVAGIVTAWASWPAIQNMEIGKTFSSLAGGQQATIIIVLGLLASGGSGPWNDLSTWVKNLKDNSK